MARISDIVCGACPRVLRWVWRLSSCSVEVGSGELVAERVEDVVGGLSRVVKSGEFAAEHRGIEQSRRDHADGRERSRVVDSGTTGRVDDPGPESD